MLATRVATAAVGIPIIFGLIWIGGWPYALAAALLFAIAAAEFFGLRYRWKFFDSIHACVPSAVLALAASYSEESWALFIILALVWPVLAFGLHVGLKTTARSLLEGWIATGLAVGATTYVGVFGSTIVLLRELDDGRDWVYLALFSTFAVDTAAYFVGRAIGRHALAPAISPKKKWEGFFGGYAGGIAAVLLLNEFLGLRIDAGPALLIALTLPIAATLGDLFESWVKRRAGVKDASELIPGHGGVLDRLDSVLFTFPLVYVVARWIA